METKICKQCGNELPVDQFYKRTNEKSRFAICKDCISKNRKEYYEENRDAILVKHQQYYKEHSEEIKKRTAIWQKEHPEKMRQKSKRKTQRRRQAAGGFTREQWDECIAFFGNVCAYSGEVFGVDLMNKITEDHIIPVSKNGNNYIWNIIPVKFKYNSARGNFEIREWYPKQSFYSEERLDLIRQWRKYARNKWA